MTNISILTNKDILYIQNVSLKRYNTFAIKSVARHFYIVKTVSALQVLKKYFEDNSFDYLVLGHGSNMLFVNKYINKNIIYMGLLNCINVSNNTITAGAGTSIKSLVTMAYSHALSGLEFLSFLPASVGGATFMNARCYGSEMSHIISSVGIIDENNTYRRIDIGQCEFAYKKSVFQNNKYIIVDVKFNLKKDEPIEIKQKMLHYKYDRIKKRQFQYPSAGCAFLNDYNTNMIAGLIIDKANMRGVKLGGSMVLPTHANFIVNYKNASGQDVLSLIKYIQKKVKQKTNIDLQNEVHIIK